GPVADMWRDMILNIEGDRHGRLRRLVSQAFTPMAVDELRPRMRATVHDLVDTFTPQGACEFMAAFADRYPPHVMSDLLGIPEEEQDQFREWGRTLALTISYSVAENLAAIDAARIGLYAATDWLCASRRHRPGDDLVSRLVAAADNGDRLTTQELRSMVFGLVVRDQAAFGPDADRFDITAERPAAQLAFGHGVHYCLGAALARAEMAEALPILAARLPGLELAGPPILRPDISGIVGPDSLPIRFL